MFFKTRPDVITPDNLLTTIVVSSMVDSPLNTLYHAMQKVSKSHLLHIMTLLNGWLDDLRVYALFNSISVISGV